MDCKFLPDMLKMWGHMLVSQLIVYTPVTIVRTQEGF